jgi:hypothetical protein
VKRFYHAGKVPAPKALYHEPQEAVPFKIPKAVAEYPALRGTLNNGAGFGSVEG